MVNLIILCIFLLVTILVSLFWGRNLRLDKLQYGMDEKILLEEYPVRVKDERGNRGTIYPNSKVIITNYRIILAQKVLLSQRLTVNYLINYGDVSKLNEQARKGVHRIYHINPSDICAKENSKGIAISIPIKKDIFDHTITFTVTRKELAFLDGQPVSKQLP